VRLAGLPGHFPAAGQTIDAGLRTLTGNGRWA